MNTFWPKKPSSQWKLLSFIAIATVVFVYFQKSPLYNGENNEIMKSDTNSEKTGLRSVDSDSSTDTTVDAQSPAVIGTNQELESWLDNEEKLVNSINVDTELKQNELKEKVMRMTVGQLNILAERARNTEKPIQSRILAAYLLTLSPQVQQSLEILNQEISTEAAAVHSTDEILKAQQRSILITVIDDLFEKAQVNPEIYVDLQKKSFEINDPVVKKYLLRRLSEVAHL